MTGALLPDRTPATDRYGRPTEYVGEPWSAREQTVPRTGSVGKTISETAKRLNEEYGVIWLLHDRGGYVALRVELGYGEENADGSLEPNSALHTVIVRTHGVDRDEPAPTMQLKDCQPETAAGQAQLTALAETLRLALIAGT